MVDRLRIVFDTPSAVVVDSKTSVEAPRWFPGARLNIAKSCFNAPGEETAIVFQPEGGELGRLTYGQLDALSNRVAGGLAEHGFEAGEAIAICMPMTVEAVAIYLGIVKAGAIAVSIADSFAPQEIATRLRIASVRAVFTQDKVRRGSREFSLFSKVIDAGCDRAIVLPLDESPPDSTLREHDLWWSEFIADTNEFQAVLRDPGDATNVLFSSGTTGDPKAIPWTQTTPIKCAADGFLHQDIRAGEVIAWPTNLGWMMGPWLIYAALVNSATIGLYYGPPTQREFGRFVAEAGVNVLGVVPSTVRAWQGSDCMSGLDWSRIRCFSSTGECSDPSSMLFLMSLAGYKPVIEYCGGTEIGGGYITGTMVQPATPTTFTTAALGLDVTIADSNGKAVDNGELFIEPPSIGLSNELLNGDHHATYFEGVPVSETGSVLRRHGDQMERLPNGYYRAHGRTDDTMNLSGIKVSSAEIEHALNEIGGIVETAAVAVSPSDGGPSQLVVYAVALDPLDAGLGERMQTALKKTLNPLFRLHDVVIVDALPRTASNKVMRRVLRDRYAQNLED
jgi:acetyl-CoA synthetase